MNILIALYNGPGFLPFFDTLGKALHQKGHKVHYAFDSRLIFYEHPQYQQVERISVFSDFFCRFKTNRNLLSKYPSYNIWDLFFCEFDRFENYGFNLNKQMPWYEHLASSLIAFFENSLNTNEIDLVLQENVSNSFSYFSYIVAQRLGVPYLGLANSRLPGRFELHQSFDGVRSNLQKTFEALQSGSQSIPDDILTELSDYMSGFMETVPDYVKNTHLQLTNPIKKYLNKAKLNVLSSRLSYVTHEPRASYPYTLSNPLSFSYRQFLRNSFRYLRVPFIAKYYSPISPNDEYFLYPMHFHPESSTSIHAQYFVDEYVAIKNIAFSLPFGTWLYVKDHALATGYKHLDHYKKLSALPNVKLLSPNENTKTLISKSKAVITLTSTVGFEAIILSKPVYVLGDVFYDFHPLCTKLRSWSELSTALAHSPSVDDASVFNFLSAYWLCTSPGFFRYGTILQSDPLISMIVNSIDDLFPV